MEEPNEEMELGGSIKLSGFSSLDRADMVVVKKMVGSYAKKMSELAKRFESLSVTMKNVHVKEKSEKYELHALLIDDGKHFSSEITDRNLFFALDKVLKRIVSEIE